MSTVAENEYTTVRVVHDGAQEWELNYAQWIHLSALIGGIVAAASAGIGLPLVLVVVAAMWLGKRSESPFVDDHGREAVNFQVSMLIYFMVVWPAAILLTCGVGVVLGIPLAVLAIVGTWQGSKAAGRGEYYRYPACIRLLH